MSCLPELRGCLDFSQVKKRPGWFTVLKGEEIKIFAHLTNIMAFVVFFFKFKCFVWNPWLPNPVIERGTKYKQKMEMLAR